MHIEIFCDSPHLFSGKCREEKKMASFGTLILHRTTVVETET
jgi:hypothetical protein